MSSSAKTRRERTAAGYCTVCLVNHRLPKMTVCEWCRETMRRTSAERYKLRRSKGLCTRCGVRTGKKRTRADPPECESCMTWRRKRRLSRRRAVGGTPGHDLPVGTSRTRRRK